MNKNIKMIIFSALIAILFTLPSFSKVDNINKSVVKIFVASNSADYFSPWKMKGTRRSNGSGAIIDNNLILTAAHVVNDSTFIQVKKYSDPKKYIAKVMSISHDSDLAILKVEDVSFFDNTKPLKIGKLPALQDTVKVMGYPRGGSKLSITKGVVSRIEVTSYSHSNRYLLTVQIDAAINPGNSGGPVVKDGQIVGIAFQGYSNSQSLGYMVPVPIINHFMEDIKDGKYDGFPKIGINSWSNTENNSLRDFYKIKNVSGGILINSINYNSPADKNLKKGDIILSIDGNDIAEDGTIEFEDERIWFGYLISNKQFGDRVGLKIIRDGELKNIVLKLLPFENLIKKKVFEKRASFYIYGGFVFTKLTENLLMEWGQKWYTKAPMNFLKYIDEEKTSEVNDVVALIKVLPDDINVGYHSRYYEVIKKVNGNKIKSLKHFIELLKDLDDDYLFLELDSSKSIIISTKEIKKANERIKNRYNVPLYSKDLEKLIN